MSVRFCEYFILSISVCSAKKKSKKYSLTKKKEEEEERKAMRDCWVKRCDFRFWPQVELQPKPAKLPEFWIISANFKFRRKCWFAWVEENCTESKTYIYEKKKKKVREKRNVSREQIKFGVCEKQNEIKWRWLHAIQIMTFHKVRSIITTRGNSINSTKPNHI